jgi:hypothetical protein
MFQDGVQQRSCTPLPASDWPAPWYFLRDLHDHIYFSNIRLRLALAGQSLQNLIDGYL